MTRTPMDVCYWGRSRSRRRPTRLPFLTRNGHRNLISISGRLCSNFSLEAWPQRARLYELPRSLFQGAPMRRRVFITLLGVAVAAIAGLCEKANGATVPQPKVQIPAVHVGRVAPPSSSGPNTPQPKQSGGKVFYLTTQGTTQGTLKGSSTKGTQAGGNDLRKKRPYDSNPH
jgi:hypothetical protein